jgi:hypothetical protein
MTSDYFHLEGGLHLRAQNAVAIEAVAGMRGKMEDAT